MAGRARYMKIIITDNNYSAEYVGIGELELYDDAENKIALTDEMLSVDSTYSTYYKYKMIDGSLTTQWVCDNTNPAWVMVDLGKQTNLSKVRFYGNGTVSGQSPYAFTINFSVDGVNWTKVIEETEKNTKLIWYEANLNFALRDKVLLASEGEIMSVITKGEITTIPSASESNFFKYGMDRGTTIDMYDSITDKRFVVKASSPLDAGKIFKKKIDLSVERVSSITL